MAQEIEPKRKGRPRVEIDLDKLEAMAMMHATQEEIAVMFGCNRRTVMKRLREPKYQLAYENGLLKGNLNLKRLSMKHANGHGSSAANMTMYLRQQWLNESKAPLVANNIQNNTLALTNASESDLRALESILARIADASASEGRVIEAGGSSAAPED